MNEMNDYQTYIGLSRYSRWLPEKGRRENWAEVVQRYFDFFPELPAELKDKVENLEVLPSMRALMTAGPALERCNVAGYNCSYLPVDHPRAFDEACYILMCGTGVGFSVERKYTDKLPVVNEHFENSETVINVADSKAGWARAYRELVGLLYTGQIPRWNVDGVRPAGAPLKTFGGRASGPEPLESLFRFTVETFTKARGRRLTPLECHDIMCKIGEVVVVGGVRRSALISLSDVSDDQAKHAKHGQWWEANPQRALANNSAVYDSRPDVGLFFREFTSLYDSKSGERGFFNREASKRQAARSERRGISRVKITLEDGTIKYMTKEEFDGTFFKIGDSI